MTKEEIREHAIKDLMDYKGFARLPTEYIVDCLLHTLDLDDVVLKVEEELPVIDCYFYEHEKSGYEKAQQDMKEAGFTHRFERLI